MIDSRKLTDLNLPARGRAQDFLKLAKDHNIDLLVTSTFRDFYCQDQLYSIGRTRNGAPCRCGGALRPLGTCTKHPKGLRVTNASHGQSWHNWRCAFDVVPIIHGKAMWDDNDLWHAIGDLGLQVGLEWAGTWRSFPEQPHFQFTNGKTLDEFRVAFPKGLPPV